MAKATMDGAKKTGQTSNPNEGVLNTLLSNNIIKIEKSVFFFNIVIVNF